MHSGAQIARWIDRYVDFLGHFGAFMRSWDEAIATDSELQRQSHLNVQRYCATSYTTTLLTGGARSLSGGQAWR